MYAIVNGGESSKIHVNGMRIQLRWITPELRLMAAEDQKASTFVCYVVYHRRIKVFAHFISLSDIAS